jgi:hypothetical protein
MSSGAPQEMGTHSVSRLCLTPATFLEAGYQGAGNRVGIVTRPTAASSEEPAGQDALPG